MKGRFTVLLVLVASLFLASCSPKPQYSVDQLIQTALAKTEAAKPTSSPTSAIPTNTPLPTKTPLPTSTPLPTATPDNMPGTLKNPFPLGMEAAFTKKDTGQEFTIAFTEAMMGNDAYLRLKAANMFNDAAPAGKQYVLAKIVVKYIKGDDILSLSSSLWQVVSGGQFLNDLVLVVEPEPKLPFDIQLLPGGSATGYIARVAIQSDPTPLFYFGDPTGFIQYFKLTQ